MISDKLQSNEIREAEIWWWKNSQLQSFPEEIKSLLKQREIARSSRLWKLNVYLDNEGVMRIRGRLENATGIGEETKFPVVLDPKHPYTNLLVLHYHTQGGHHGRERIINEIRQKFCILNLRSAVRST